MTDLVLYTNPQSRGRIVHWMMEELGEPYRTVWLDYGAPMKAADYLAVNPMGKVPALRHGDVVVTEAAAICTYLADRFPDKGLAPPSASPARAAYYRWLFFAAGPLEAAVTARALNLEAPPDRQGMAGYGSFESVMDTLSVAVSGDGYVAGERFSAADVYVGSHVGWGLQFGSIEDRPEFRDYWARVSDRNTYRHATALDDAAATPAAGA